MGIVAQTRAGLGFLKRAVAFRSLGTAALIQRNLPNVAVPVRAEGTRIALDELGFSFDPATHPFYLPHMVVARDLVRSGHGIWENGDDGAPVFVAGPLRFSPEVRDDLLVLEETFLRRIYDHYPERKPFVLDIGANVGIVASFFAGIKGWEVLAFEPFPETFAAARRNVSRNGLDSRVHLREAGVDGLGGTLRVAGHAESRATNGIFGNLHKERSGADQSVEIRLVGAEAALDEALALAGERPVFVKMDCEGAEYAIVERWAASGRLSSISAMVLEYHFILPEHRVERIIEPLRAAGFVVQGMWGSAEAGGLFAIRT